MDWERLEEIFDEQVLSLIQNLNNNGVELPDAVAIIDALGRLAHDPRFHDFYFNFEMMKGDPWYKDDLKEFFNM